MNDSDFFGCYFKFYVYVMLLFLWLSSRLLIFVDKFAYKGVDLDLLAKKGLTSYERKRNRKYFIAILKHLEPIKPRKLKCFQSDESFQLQS